MPKIIFDADGCGVLHKERSLDKPQNDEWIDTEFGERFEEYISQLNKAFVKYEVKKQIRTLEEKERYLGLFEDKVSPKEYVIFEKEIQNQVDIIIGALNLDPEIVKFKNLINEELHGLDISLYQKILNTTWIWFLYLRKFWLCIFK